MSEASDVIDGPAPAFEGPVVCTLPLGDVREAVRFVGTHDHGGLD